MAVTDLSLTVDRGQVFGLLGPNGSGKTTTLRMMLGLVHPTSGSAHIFGHRMVPGHPVLRRVGVLVEKPAFVPYLSGRRNLELFWRAGGQDLREANLERALEVAGLGDATERKAGTYSKGMLQRLGLAQVLLNQPDLLVLDEPTIGLDPQETHRVRLRELRGRAIKAMREFAQFNPYLTGSVLNGNAGKFADITLQLFTDNVKAVELYLIDNRIPYKTAQSRLYSGEALRTVPVFTVNDDGIDIQLTVLSTRDLRAPLKTRLGGRAIDRAKLRAVETLLDAT